MQSLTKDKLRDAIDSFSLKSIGYSRLNDAFFFSKFGKRPSESVGVRCLSESNHPKVAKRSVSVHRCPSVSGFYLNVSLVDCVCVCVFFFNFTAISERRLALQALNYLCSLSSLSHTHTLTLLHDNNNN